jgi:hypothetical protein
MRGVPVVVGEHAASDGVNKYGVVLKSELGAGFSDKLVDYTVAAAWTVMGERNILSAAGECFIHTLLRNLRH